MLRSGIVTIAATFALLFAAFLAATSCASPGPRVSGAAASYGENAMEIMELPLEYATPPPPPPPVGAALEGPGEPVVEHAGSSGVIRRNGDRAAPLRPPATDTASEPADDDAAAAVDPVDNKPFRGLGSFVDPGDMEVENWHPLRFLAGPDQPSLEREAGGRALGPSNVIYMAPWMRVTLPADDPNFQIMLQSPSVRNIGLDRTASWQWKVKPINAGKKLSLFATVEILERGPDGQPIRRANGDYKVLDDYTRQVDIRVRVGTWAGFLNAVRNAVSLGDLLGTLFRSWEKTLAALTALIAAAAALWAAIQKLRKGDAARPAKRKRPRGSTLRRATARPH
jgi:hypothetical protein